jgi:P pilus assembly chaperone PapD
MSKKTILILLLIPFAALKAFSQGNLLISPGRVVIEEGKQKEDLNLTNIGQDTAVYVVSFIHYQMLVDGSFKILEKPDSATRADKYLRLFPRRITLPPNQSQTIVLQFRKQSNMKAGEYRSHIYFRAEKEITPLGMKDPKLDSTKMAVRITPIFGLSIPAIIRVGSLKLQISLSDVKLSALNDSTSRLNFTINRTGEKSAYGNFKVEYLPEKGKKIEVGVANGVGVYTELAKRNFSMSVKLTNAMKLYSGRLIIRYLTPVEDGNTELARVEYVIH